VTVQAWFSRTSAGLLTEHTLAKLTQTCHHHLLQLLLPLLLLLRCLCLLEQPAGLLAMAAAAVQDSSSSSSSSCKVLPVTGHFSLVLWPWMVTAGWL
jgi:hypothetical protein